MYINTSRTERATPLPFVIASQRYSLVLQARANRKWKILPPSGKKSRRLVRPFARSLAHSLVRSHSRLARQLWIGILDQRRKFQSNEKLLALILSTFRATHMRTKIQCDKLMHDSLHDGSPKAARNFPQGASPPFGLGRAERTGICVRGKEIRCYSHVCSLSKYIEM